MTRIDASRLPLPPSLTVGAARDAYLDENGFDVAGYQAPTFDVEFLGRTVTMTNSRDRKWAIPLHDLHHAATGYGTDLPGEAEIGAFELMGGCRTPIVYALNLGAAAAGLLLAPLRTLRAFRVARGMRTLFRDATPYDELLALSLGDLRARLGIPEAGLAHRPRRLHDAVEHALPTAPPIGAVTLALALLLAVAAIATGVATTLARGPLTGHPLLGGGAAALGLTLLMATVRARVGSLGARALAGHTALGLALVGAIGLLR